MRFLLFTTNCFVYLYLKVHNPLPTPHSPLPTPHSPLRHMCIFFAPLPNPIHHSAFIIHHFSFARGAHLLPYKINELQTGLFLFLLFSGCHDEDDFQEVGKT